MIDLTGCKEVFEDYAGSERKTALMYDGHVYMIKAPDPIRQLNNDLSYMNNQFSEDIGCRIFKSLNIPTQDTFIAKYTNPEDNKTRIVVACKDFRNKQIGEDLVSAGNINLRNFNSSKIISSSIEDVDYVINKINTIDKEAIKERFWDMFVGDALIANKDRHMDNWGFITKNYEIVRMAPVYDCGSSLGSLISDEKMKEGLSNPNLFKDLEYNVASVYSINEKRIFYHEILKNPPEELKKAILRIVPKINMNIIQNIVNNEEGMSDIRKNYLIKALTLRYENILIPSLTKIMKEKYSSAENIADIIIKDLKAGKSLKSIEKEAFKFIPDTSIVRKRAKYNEALKLASKDKSVKKILEKQQDYER